MFILASERKTLYSLCNEWHNTIFDYELRTIEADNRETVKNGQSNSKFLFLK